MSEFILTGVKQLDRHLKNLERKTGNRIARGALSKGAQIGSKAVKKEIPSRQKSARKAIGWTVKKNKQKVTEAKFGTVGKRSASLKRGKKHSGGVGISKRNIHWLILGTGERTQKKTGKSVGKMKGVDYVGRGAQKAKKAITQGIVQRSKELLFKEVEKRGV